LKFLQKMFILNFLLITAVFMKMKY